MVESNPLRYRAFISYSKRDQNYAKRLHSALETYRVPKAIVAPVQQDRRLGRFFRDDDEMGASVDLGGALREALENSENLIVICSPHAARSKWVNEEIRHFRNSGRRDRIFAVIVDGIPNSDDPELNCFPPALVPQAVSTELISEQHAEPLAIDLRKESFQRARIRLVAGLLRISFDSLWQREKRRTMRRRAVAAVVSMALLSIIVVLGMRWLAERGRVEEQRIDRTLVTVRDDLASERVRAGLTTLQSLTAEGKRGPVEDVLKTALSWVSTPAELLKEIKPPAFISNGTQLFFLSTNGSRTPVNIHQPYRRVLSSDRRWLLILGAEEAVMLDVADGRELARTRSNQIQWFGEAFETSSGLLVVTGRYSGGNNISFRESFLVFAPQRKTLTVFNQHWDGSEEQYQYRFIHPLYVSSNCGSFGVVREGFSFADQEAAPAPADMFFISADKNGLKPAPAPDSLSEWTAAQIFVNESDQLGLDRYQAGGAVPADMGCKAPASDSTRRDSQQILTGPVRPVGLEGFWESAERWKVTGNVEPQSPFQLREREIASSNPCSSERGCPVQDPEDDTSVFEFDSDPTSVTPPRGLPKSDHSFDRVDGEFVYAYSHQASGGYLSTWCRKLAAKTVCLTRTSPAEFMNDVTDFEIRSPLGRFVFYPQGASQGFRLYDLLTMRNVTPKGPEFVASTHWADFSSDEKRLFVTMNGRLLIFEPRSDGPWQLVSDGAPVQIPALTGTQNDRVAGLLALDDDSLIAVRSSGVISRFDWRTGQQSWGRTIGNIGDIVRVVISKNRRFVLLVGSAGGRLLDTTDGLVLSGVLVPPPAMDGSIDILQSLSHAFVSETGAIEVSAGEKQYRREPVTFNGDIQSRLKEILAEASRT